MRTVHREPLVQVFALGEAHREAEVPRSLHSGSVLLRPGAVTASHRVMTRTSVASAYLRSWYCFVPSGTSLRGLNVRVLPLQCHA